uniref:Uncharacterized protein n=1 Tax=Anguilla anguilla TaxID=7936 RepID=A0A0E9U7V4_ANGAN
MQFVWAISVLDSRRESLATMLE